MTPNNPFDSAGGRKGISIEENDRRQLAHLMASSIPHNTGEYPKAIVNPADADRPFIVNSETEELALYDSARYIQAVEQAKAAKAVKVEPSEVVVSRLQAQLAEMQARMAEMAEKLSGHQSDDDADGGAARRGPGRPKKNAEA